MENAALDIESAFPPLPPHRPSHLHLPESQTQKKQFRFKQKHVKHLMTVGKQVAKEEIFEMK